jgi:hypothetical protein
MTRERKDNVIPTKNFQEEKFITEFMIILVRKCPKGGSVTTVDSLRISPYHFLAKIQGMTGFRDFRHDDPETSSG